MTGLELAEDFFKFLVSKKECCDGASPDHLPNIRFSWVVRAVAIASYLTLAIVFTVMKLGFVSSDDGFGWTLVLAVMVLLLTWLVVLGFLICNLKFKWFQGIEGADLLTDGNFSKKYNDSLTLVDKDSPFRCIFESDFGTRRPTPVTLKSHTCGIGVGEHGNLTPCNVEDTITLKLEREQLLVVPADNDPGEQPTEVKVLDFGDEWHRIFPRELPSVSTANSELPAHLKVILNSNATISPANHPDLVLGFRSPSDGGPPLTRILDQQGPQVQIEMQGNRLGLSL